MNNITKTFNLAREFIKREWGLDLTLIELVRLREDYVKPRLELADSLVNKKTDAGFDPDEEAATSFLLDYYCIPAHDEYWVGL